MVTFNEFAQGRVSPIRRQVAIERAPRLMLVTDNPGLVAGMRATAETSGWSVVPATEAGATPEMIACCDLVLVDIEVGFDLIQRIARYTGPRLVGVVGGWDLRSAELAQWCPSLVHYPAGDAEFAALLAATATRPR